MAKDKSAVDAGTAKPKLDTEALRAEVKAFASQLGISAVSSEAFDYGDFAPEKAAKKIKQPHQQPSKAATTNQQQQRKRQQFDRQPERSKQQSAVQANSEKRREGRQQQFQKQHEQQQQQQQQQQEKEEQHLNAVRNRTWVEGVGPRPGEARGKSLLGKDEPTIWYEAAAALPKLNSNTKPPLNDSAAEQLRQRAEALLDQEQQLFEMEMGSRNATDARWLAQVRKSGTTSDKIAAMSLMVSSSATANIKSLDGLLALMGKTAGGKHVVVAAMEALQELFLTALLPDRKLRVLEQQPLQVLPPGKDGERCLLLWAVEDAVRRRYHQYIQLLQKCSTDDLDFIKAKATKAISRLLSAKPEGEQVLLSALVNKLGDPSRKLASDAGYLLGQLLLEHPAMKPVVVREVERFMFRPGLTDRARYYSVTFLNQLALSHRPQEGGSALAQKLIDIYFSLFKLLLEGKLGNAAVRRKQEHQQQQQRRGKGGRGFRKGGHSKRDENESDADDGESLQEAGELDARMLSALITGVRRAFPYVESDAVEPLIESHGEKLFKLVHTAPFTVALQALMLMHQLLSGRNAVSDRFYRALYAVLLTEGATGAAGVRAPQFMSLLVKAMRTDVSIKRVAAFSKRLLQDACHTPSNWAAGALLLLSEVLKAQPGLWAAVQQPEDTAGQAEHFTDAPAGSDSAADGSDDVEVFKDVRSDDDSGSDHDDQEAVAAAAAAAVDKQQQQQQSVSGMANGVQNSAGSAGVKWPKEDYYDMRKREPLYASAEVSCWWELLLLSRHSHPSVAAFAQSLLAGSPVQYSGDPLKDLGLPAFLAKFVNKKPKAAPRGTSLMQPSHTMAAAAAVSGAAKADVAALGSEAFAALAEAEVSTDQLFFHRFFNLHSVKAKQTATARAKARHDAAEKTTGLGGVLGSDEDDWEAELGSDDIDDAEIDAALQEAEGVGDDALGDPDIGFDYDTLMSAMEDSHGDVSGSDHDSADHEEDDAAAAGASDQERGGSSGSDADDDETSSSDGDDWVMLDGTTTAAAAVVGSSKQQQGKKRSSGSAGIQDADLQDVNVLDLPSPSSSDDEQQQQQQKGRKKHKRSQQQQQSDDPDLDQDLDDLILGGDDLAAAAVGSSDDEAAAAAAAAAAAGASRHSKATASKQQNRQKQKRSKGGAGLFASADGYKDYFAEYDAAAAVEKPAAEPSKAQLGTGSRQRRQGGSMRRQHKPTPQR